MCTKEPSRSVRVDFVQLCADAGDADSAHGGDVRQNPIRLFDWIKVELESFRKYLACEAVVLVVDTFRTVAEVSGEACGVERCELRGVGIREDQGTRGFAG